MEFNPATINLCDFSHSSLTLSIKSLEITSFLEFLLACLGHVVHVFAAGFWMSFCTTFCLGSLLCFLFTCIVSQSYEYRGFLPDVNMHVLCNWEWNVVRSLKVLHFYFQGYLSNYAICLKHHLCVFLIIFSTLSPWCIH